MSFTTAMYEGDSIIRYAPPARPATQGTAGARRIARPAKHRTRHGAIAVLIGAIWNALRSAVLWIDEKSRQAHRGRFETYLAESSDLADLERRLRNLEYRGQLNWIDCGSR